MAIVFLYQCPTLGLRVQGWAEDAAEEGGEAYEAVSCTACGRTHLVNPRNGHTLMARRAAEPVARGGR